MNFEGIMLGNMSDIERQILYDLIWESENIELTGTENRFIVATRERGFEERWSRSLRLTNSNYYM